MNLKLGDIDFRINEDKEIDTCLFAEFVYDDHYYLMNFSKDETFKLFKFLSDVFDNEASSGTVDNVIKE